jgi:hypothetical protein
MAVAWSPLFSALFFLVAGVLRSISWIRHINRDFYNESEQQDLYSPYLQSEWDHRSSLYPMYAISNTLQAIAWVLFLVPMLQLAWVLSRGGKRSPRIHGAIVGFTLFGTMTELMARFLTFGVTSSGLYLSATFNMDKWLPASLDTNATGDIVLDQMGWKDLEVAFLVLRGMTTYVDAFEFICLFVVLLCVYYSVQTMQNRVFSIWWARMGILVSLICIFQFAASVIYELDRNHTFIRAAAGFSIINSMLLLPLWLIILGFALPKTLPTYIPARDRDVSTF